MHKLGFVRGVHLQLARKVESINSCLCRFDGFDRLQLFFVHVCYAWVELPVLESDLFQSQLVHLANFKAFCNVFLL